jgi:FkbM family methyltransferase
MHKLNLNCHGLNFDFCMHDPGIDRMVSRKILKHNGWESNITKIWIDHIRPGDVVVDIGANIGWYSKIAQLQQAEVFAFEPDPRNFQVLEQNCPHAHLFESALGDCESTTTIKYNPDNFGDTRVAPDGDVVVNQTTLDAVIGDRAGEIRAIKMDVQGWEPHVLHGAANTMKNLPSGCLVVLEFCPVLLAENNFDMHCLDDFFQLFSNSYALRKEETLSIDHMIEWAELVKNDSQLLYADTVNFV